MKIPSTSEKPKNLVDLSGNEAVKVSTKSSSAKAAENAVQIVADSGNSASEGKATSVKLGLARYILEELDPKKVVEARQAKIADLKARIENGTYLESINSEKLAEKILEESQLEGLIAGKAANND